MNRKNYRRLFLPLVVIFLLVSFYYTGGEEELFVIASEEKTPEVDSSLPLKEQIDTILEDERLDGAITGVSVRKADTGEEIYSNHGDIRLHPASNMKILTASAALETLGPDYQFTTEVLTDGKMTGNVLQGNLYLKGKGDPTLLEADLEKFAKTLKDQGITKIKGNLIGDDSWYDDIRLSQDLNWSDEPFYTGAQVSALTLSPDNDYDAGTVIVESQPGEGEQAEVTVTPRTDYVTIVNKTKMVKAGETKQISIEREHGSNRIIVEGQMPADGSTTKKWVSVWKPTGYALDVFKKALENNGVTFIGNAKINSGQAPENAKELTSKQSIPVAELLLPFMKLSNNGHGEVLTKEMGKVVFDEGSWDKGLEVMEDVITSFGVSEDAILLRDGSGMSHKNYIPASELTKLLYKIQEKDWYSEFEYALPVAGISDRMVGGTLRNRMTEEPTKGNVKAKTGSLTGVYTLSGYVTSADGEKLIFSILNNNYIDGSMAPIQDAIASVLASYEFE
ncbi:D-alanyl-D-alanine carboxypeptidase/D-alanyl-D-alanine endopeptidase [Oceanobacillus halophilus]|uniref:D-alanyl-D-alanine carboxypeptidase/D-alanyl-D-alanine-endopeptidase n=1 Tax=Oceanobacillus halophilus TaxID=930130 RepID=A0A495A0V6_9BACI|nr:D-alanyl-D-alanine carboxypeptidase/D-alanyl-D-alanine-endopeptidase [Oceanobacillus halophilus]RKQ33052.1 D-alanyl-D-alanine carboxypeptidase/D-alanyl-D-alanine-endopeptidase [Oceanobacillus halophilus]